MRGPRRTDVVECRTYRWRGHVGPAADLDVGEDRRHELDVKWQRRDPIAQSREQLRAQGVSSEWFDTREAAVYAGSR